MPFTPSHIAAVLPFVRTPLVPSALVIGSVVPDLVYYVPLPIPRGFTHSLVGAVTIDLALGIVLFVLWHLLLRAPVADLSPGWLRNRLPPQQGLKPGDMGWPRASTLVVLSLLLGIATHLIWDSFTHDGWVVSQLPALQQTFGPLAGYKWAQHGSTVIGAAIVTAWVLIWVRRTPVAQRPTGIAQRLRVGAWALVLGVAIALALSIWLGGVIAGTAVLDGSLLFVALTLGIGAGALVVVGLSIGWWTRRR